MRICRRCLSTIDEDAIFCSRCGAHRDGTPAPPREDPVEVAPRSRRPDADRAVIRPPTAPAESEEHACPRCGQPAEVGTIYTDDSAYLVFRAGSADWWGNVVTGAFGAGEPIGERSAKAGLHIPCLRCPACRIIVFRY